MEYGVVLIVLAALVGLWMTWGVGANDLANIMSTALGSRSITVRQALTIAIFFEIVGAFLGGSGVTNTLRGGIVNLDAASSTPILLIYAMLAALFAGATWIHTASFWGMPVSITNSIIGALIGVTVVILGMQAVHWPLVGYIAISWLSSPAIAGVVGYFLLRSIDRCILNKINPAKSAHYYIPAYLCLVGLVLAFMTSLKGVAHFNIQLTLLNKIGVVAFTVASVMLFGFVAMRRIHRRTELTDETHGDYIESLFTVLMGLTACAMVFAHGSNDVAIAVGPMAHIVGVILTGQPLQEGFMLSSMMLFGCLSVILGLSFYGKKVIATVGSAITVLTPTSAFAATLAAASTVVVSTSIGIPVSATQTLVGAIFGVGLARGIEALNLSVLKNIFMSWLITIPVSAVLATMYFFLFKKIFG